MAVEIKELIIRATIIPDNDNETSTPDTKTADSVAIIDECVREVLRILKKNNQR